MISRIRQLAITSRPGHLHGAGRGMWLLSASTILTLALGTAVQAQEKQSVKVGETDLYPEVRLEYRSLNNALLTRDNQIDATGFVVSPRVEWVASRRLLDLTATYQGDFAAFSEDQLNYDDHRLEFAADAELSARKRLNGSLTLLAGHERLGTLRTRGLSDSTDEQITFTDIVAEGRYTYGADTARGNVSGGLLIKNLSFSSQGALTEGDSYTLVEPSAIFSLRASPTTRALVELRYGVFDFEDDSRDGEALTLLTGVTLAPSGKTSGTVKLGGTSQSYSSSARPDTNELVAEVALVFRPRSFSEIALRYDRQIDSQDSSAAGDGAESVLDRASVRWNHNWTSRFNSNAFVSLSNRNRDCPDEDESITRVGLDFSLSVRRWLSIGAGVSQLADSVTSCDAMQGGTGDGSSLDTESQTINVHIKATL